MAFNKHSCPCETSEENGCGLAATPRHMKSGSSLVVSLLSPRSAAVTHPVVTHTHPSPSGHIGLLSGHSHCHTLCFKKPEARQLINPFFPSSHFKQMPGTLTVGKTQCPAPSTKTNKTSSVHKGPVLTGERGQGKCNNAKRNVLKSEH